MGGMGGMGGSVVSSSLEPGQEIVEIMIPSNKVGLIIGMSFCSPHFHLNPLSKISFLWPVSVLYSSTVLLITSCFVLSFAGKGGEMIKALQVRVWSVCAFQGGWCGMYSRWRDKCGWV